ncbi:hypothetical protein WN944_017082 [Citrus x changshan-huyou]|uniref:Uncharacterized protein n=1 Tax=Citrus x changshan-huyou TaxID=2935761 RepID=A0AAP0QP75_9ROSI
MGVLIGKGGFYGNVFRIAPPLCFTKEDASRLPCRCHGLLNDEEVKPSKNWELMAPWTGVQIEVPVKFIVGDQDLVYNNKGMKEYIHNGGFKKYVPYLQEVVVMEGVAHFINQEKAEEKPGANSSMNRVSISKYPIVGDLDATFIRPGSESIRLGVVYGQKLQIVLDLVPEYINGKPGRAITAQLTDGSCYLTSGVHGSVV